MIKEIRKGIGDSYKQGSISWVYPSLLETEARVRSSLPAKMTGGPLEASGRGKAVYISPPPYLVEDGIGYRCVGDS